MTNKLIGLILTVSTISTSYGQNEMLSNLERSIEVGINHSYLAYNTKGLDKRYTIELRVGGNVRTPISNGFGINAGLRIGIKPKTNIYYNGLPPYDNPLYISNLDKTLSQTNHYFAEIPVVFDYRIEKFQIGIGTLLRYYLNIGGPDGIDVIKGRYETGFLARCNYNLVEKLSIGIEGYFGLSSLISVYYINPGTQTGTGFKAKNNYVGLHLVYKLDKK